MLRRPRAGNRRTRGVFRLLLLTTLGLPLCSALVGQRTSDPELHWIFPLGASQGTTVTAEICGDGGLDRTYAAWLPGDGLSVQVQGVESVQAQEVKPYKAQKKSSYAVKVTIEVAPDAALGAHSLRMVSPHGVSSAVTFWVHPAGISDTPKSTSRPRGGKSDAARSSLVLPKSTRSISLPFVGSGRIASEGHVEYYSFTAMEGDDLTFDLLTNEPRFRPTFVLFETIGSWLSPKRPRRLFAKQESVDATTGLRRWRHQFKKSGIYLVRVGSHYGAAAEQFIYELRIQLVSKPHATVVAHAPPRWRERAFDRSLDAEHLNRIWARGAGRPEEKNVTTPQKEVPPTGTANTATPATRPDAPTDDQAPHRYLEEEPNERLADALAISAPALVEGMISRQGDADLFRFQVKSGERLVFEVETPTARPPYFNPTIEILDADGAEFLTNKHSNVSLVRQDPISYLAVLKLHLAEQEDCGLHSVSFFKELEPKTIVTFGKPGDYYLRVRDITTQLGAEEFHYRVFVRRPIPHVGDITLEEDRVNLDAGVARKLSLVASHEEGFSGAIAFEVTGLPAGVSAITGSFMKPTAPPGPASDHEESFVPRTQEVTILLLANRNAPSTERPAVIGITARPVVAGKLGEPFSVGELPLMVRNSKNAPAKENDADK